MKELLQVNKNWLKYARISLNYTEEEVGQELGIQTNKIVEWEKTGKISPDNLKELSVVYDVSELMFLNDKTPPKITKNSNDFRTERNKRTPLNPDILKEIKRAKYKRERLLNILEDLQLSYKFKDYSATPISKNMIISTIRKSLNINNHKLKNYTSEQWIRELESLNILVFQFYNIKPQEVKGYSFNYEELPIIGINYNGSEIEKILSLFHEYTYLLLNQSGVSGNYNDEKEKQMCNDIVTEILLPVLYENNKTVQHEKLEKETSEVQRLKKLASENTNKNGYLYTLILCEHIMKMY